ncbi:MAG: hypothetical protein ACRDRZ_04315 [Pseudonocardiaceae bacterium]
MAVPSARRSRRRHYLKEIIPAGPGAVVEADKTLRRLANQVDERRNPRTNATVDQLLDRHFDLVQIETNTLDTYRGLARNHIRPLIGGQKVGALDADMFGPTSAGRCRHRASARSTSSSAAR